MTSSAVVTCTLSVKFKLDFQHLIQYLNCFCLLQRKLVSPSEEIEEESIQPVTMERDSMVHEAVSRVVSNIMPTGLDTMTTLNDTTPGKLP